jgi:hypothetical protein
MEHETSLNNENPPIANVLLADGVRPFDELIKEIEFDGEKFIPAQKIAALCFNYNEKAVKNKAKCGLIIHTIIRCGMFFKPIF